MTTATVSRNDIKGLNGRELVDLFNDLTGNSTKRFSTRAAGLKRTLAAYDDAKGAKLATNYSGKAKTAKAAKVEVVPVGDVARKRRLTFEAKDLIKAHRPNTRRAQVIQMLSRPNGASVQQVMDAIPDWDYKTAFEGIKLINAYTGYGLEEDVAGRIHLIGSPTA